MKTTLLSSGRITLPAELREFDDIREGTEFAIQRIEAGKYLLARLPSKGSPGIYEWLLECPEKGWFQAIKSELTNDLQYQSRERNTS